MEHPIVRINLLGSPSITCGVTRVDSRLPASTLLLLAMLALRPGWAHRREELAFALWPDRSERDARANLRRHLYVLQNELPASAAQTLECTTKTVAWSPPDAWVDVNEFERLSATSEGVEAAIYLYRGDFLPHLDHEWAERLRETLRETYCRALERAIEQRRALDDVVGSLRYVEQLLATDPWREDALRTQMLLRMRIGDRAGALNVYDGFRRRIRVELSAEPMAETIAWRDAIARGVLPADRADMGKALVCA